VGRKWIYTNFQSSSRNKVDVEAVYQQQLMDQERARQAQVANYMARQQVQEKADEEGRSIWSKIGSFIGATADRVWTDDFSAVPVAGPAASAVAQRYERTTQGISAGLSTAALASNPKYWSNRDEGSDILADASRVQPGRALVAAIDAMPNPQNDGFNIYAKDENFNIADDQARDEMFENDLTLKIASGTVDGLATFFLDPFVLGGKGVKVARSGTTAFGLQVPGMTGRRVYDQSGRANMAVLGQVEREADEALAFARGLGGKETPVGVIGQRIAERDYEELLKLWQFKGQNRDQLAAFGSVINNKEDAIMFVAAAAGSKKYQQLMKEQNADIMAGMIRTVNGSPYENLLLNTPIGARQHLLLDNMLEPGIDVQKVLQAASKRDPILKAELERYRSFTDFFASMDDAASGLGPLGLMDRIGGTNVKGMQIAQAWRDGRLARKSPIGREARGPEGLVQRLDSRYGTGPAVYERVFQISGNMPRIRLLDWVGGYTASGYINLRDWNSGKAVDELKAYLSDSRVISKDRTFVAEQLAIFGRAGQSAEMRFGAIKQIEQNVARRLGQHYGASDEVMMDAYKMIDKNRAEVVAKFRNRAYGVVDAGDGSIIVTSPLLRSQLETSMPMLNARVLEKSARVAGKFYNRDGLTGGLAGTQLSATAKNLIDEIQSLWKASVLIRGGYTQRNTLEGWLRSAAFLGSVPALKAAPRGFLNSFYNNKRRLQSISLGGGGSLRSRLPITGLRGLALREKEALDQINDLQRARAEIAWTGTGTVDDGVARMANDLDQQIAGLQTTLKQIRDKRTNLSSRRFYGDDGAFAGEHGDLIRRMSSAETTTKNFLESAWMRGQQELLDANNWVKIQPGKPQYWQELAVAARQFRNDDVARRLLQGEDIGSVIAWVRSNQGRGYRRDMRLARDEVEGKVTEIANMIDSYLPLPAAKAMAAQGDVTAGQLQQVLGRLLNNKSGEGKFLSLSPIHGREVSLQLQGSVIKNLYNKPIQALFRLLGTYSESTLVRHPFYAEVWNRRVNALTMTARKQGRNIDANTADGAKLMEQINQSAHRYAMRATNETLYTIERYSNLANAMRWFSPFFAAWENSFTVFAKLIANDPSIAARANILWNIPNQLGMVVDRDGNKVEAKAWRWLTGESNQHYIVVPKQMNDALSKFTGGLPIQFSQGGANVVTPGNYPYLPGFGPVVTISAGKFLAAKPDTQKFLREKLGDAVYEQIAPFGVPQDTLEKGAMPPWVRAAYRRWQGEENEHYLKTAEAMMQNAMTEWYLSGGRPEDKPDMDVVLQRANDFYLFSMFSLLVAPVAPSRLSPYQQELDYWNQLKQDPTTTYREKQDQFIRKFGDGYLPLIASSSRSAARGLDPTIGVYRVLQENSGLARELAATIGPEAIGIVASSAPLGELDPGALQWLSSTDIPGTSTRYREGIGPGTMQTNVILQRAWREYRQAKESRDAMLRQRGVTNINAAEVEDIRLAWNQYTRQDMTRKYGEAWAVALNSYELDGPKYLVGVQMALDNEKFMEKHGGTALWQNIRVYMDSRQRALDLIGAGADSKMIRQAWERWSMDFKYSSLEFADFYEKFLEQDSQLREIGLSSLGAT
jgi:hypothetical protein